MRTNQRAFMAVFSAAILMAGNSIPAQTGDVTAVNTNALAASISPNEGILMQFRDAPLESVLEHLSQAAGFSIAYGRGVQVDGTVTAWSDQPLTKDEAVHLLESVLADHKYSVVREDKLLTIYSSGVGQHAPVLMGSNPADIPRNAEVVTQIIPVRNLNPVELQKIILPMLPSSASLSVNESANALLLTDTQANVHRVAEIIAALDSVSATANTLRVFPLKYADAKALAAVVKELFAVEAQASGGSGAANRTPNIRVRGNGVLPGGPGNLFSAAGADNTDTGRTPVSRVAATADEHGNALIVSAPEALLPAIEQLVAAVDLPAEDITDFQVFDLVNADATEMANELAALFPSDNNSSDASSAQIRFSSQGVRGAPGVGARQGNPSTENSGASGRMQKLGRVLAVPDPRTGRLLVSAAKSLMPEIALVIQHLDGLDVNRAKIHMVQLNFADVWEVQRVLQDLFPSTTTTSTSAAMADPFLTRAEGMLNTQSASGAGSSTGRTSPAGTGSGRGVGLQ